MASLQRAAFSATAVAASRSRSSFVLIGFCDENRTASKINFNSMSGKINHRGTEAQRKKKSNFPLCTSVPLWLKKSLVQLRVGSFRFRFGFRRWSDNRLRHGFGDFDFAKMFRLDADELFQADQFQQSQKSADHFRTAGGGGKKL